MHRAPIGIDFGTSNSTAGHVVNGRPVLFALEDGKPTLPSVLFFDYEDESVQVGRAALANYLSGTEGRLLRSLKSVLGSSLMDAQTELFDQQWSFRQILGTFLADLKRRTELQVGHPVDYAVLGRPVHFVDDDARADRLAQNTLAAIAHEVGFREVSFEYEPIAAALEYEQQATREELALIVDIGGGTSDFSLIRVRPGRKPDANHAGDILASAGVHIGGTDFDRLASLAEVMPLLGYRTLMRHKSIEVPASYYYNLATWHTINLLYERKTWTEMTDVAAEVADPVAFGRLLKIVEHRSGHQLAIAVEQAKIDLSGADTALLALDMIETGLTHLVDRQHFDQAIDAAVGQVGATIQTLLTDAGIRASQVGTLFLTGGSSSVPHLQQRILSMFPDALVVEGDRFGSVGSGLALEAARRYR